MGLTIGILTPRSDMFPTMGKDLLQGFRLGLGEEQDEVKYLVEGIGNATDDTVIRTAEKLLIQEAIDLVITFCGSHLLEELVKVFQSYQKPLFHIDLGGNVLKEKHQSKHIAYHSLHFWQANYAAGKYAAETFGKKALFATSFYDGGYQQSEALASGFRDHGGEIEEFYVAPMDYKSEDYSSLIQRIEDKDPSVVFLQFSFKEGDKVLQAISNASVNGKYPFVAMPMLADETMYDKDHGVKQLTSVASWAFDEDLPAMQKFVSRMVEKHRTSPNIMHLLGYELALVTVHLLNTHGEITKNLSEVLQRESIETPRGLLTYNTYGEAQVDTFKIRKFVFNEVRYHNNVIDTTKANFSEALYKKFEAIPYTGWQNPYICT